MDGGGPFRMPPSADRRTTNRPATEPRRSEDSSRVEAPAPGQQSRSDNVSSGRKEPKGDKKSSNKVIAVLVSIIVVIVLVIAGWITYNNVRNANTGIDTGRYQAIFLTNGQIYFGKLQTLNDHSLKMTDIFYLQPEEAVDEENTEGEQPAPSNNIKLMKLGSEVIGAEDQIIFLKDQVLYYENLKEDSQVVKTIEQYKKAN